MDLKNTDERIVYFWLENQRGQAKSGRVWQGKSIKIRYFEDENIERLLLIKNILETISF